MGSKDGNDVDKTMLEPNSSSSSSLSASQWTTVLERTSPLENGSWFMDQETKKNDQAKPDQPTKPSGIHETPKLLARPLNSRLVTAEEVLASDGPNDWSKLTEFMRTRTISRPERSRSEPMQTNVKESTQLSKKRRRPPSPE